MQPLETERLRLRPFTLADDGFILGLLNDPGYVRFIGDRRVRSLEAARAYLRQGPLASYARHGFGLWCVERRADGVRVGKCGLLKREALDEVDLGYAFLAREAGRGLATEAARAVLGHARNVLGLARVVALTQPDNRGSVRVLAKLGFVAAGTCRLPGQDGDSLFFATALPHAVAGAGAGTGAGAGGGADVGAIADVGAGA